MHIFEVNFRRFLSAGNTEKSPATAGNAATHPKCKHREAHVCPQFHSVCCNFSTRNLPEIAQKCTEIVNHHPEDSAVDVKSAVDSVEGDRPSGGFGGGAGGGDRQANNGANLCWIRWNNSDLTPFEKNFYKPSEQIMALSDTDFKPYLATLPPVVWTWRTQSSQSTTTTRPTRRITSTVSDQPAAPTTPEQRTRSSQTPTRKRPTTSIFFHRRIPVRRRCIRHPWQLPAAIASGLPNGNATSSAEVITRNDDQKVLLKNSISTIFSTMEQEGKEKVVKPFEETVLGSEGVVEEEIEVWSLFQCICLDKQQQSGMVPLSSHLRDFCRDSTEDELGRDRPESDLPGVSEDFLQRDDGQLKKYDNKRSSRPVELSNHSYLSELTRGPPSKD